MHPSFSLSGTLRILPREEGRSKRSLLKELFSERERERERGEEKEATTRSGNNTTTIPKIQKWKREERGEIEAHNT